MRSRPGQVPYYGAFEARDGKKLVLGVVGEDHLWRNLCAATGLDDRKDLDFSARLRIGDQLAAELRTALQQRDRDEWLRLFEETDVPATPVNTLEEAMRDEQYVERKLVFQAQDPDGLPISLLRNPILPPDASIEGEGVPRLGENTFEILEKIGYSLEEVERLRASGVI
jgi:CoA:oxalate CoA-transferase